MDRGILLASISVICITSNLCALNLAIKEHGAVPYFPLSNTDTTHSLELLAKIYTDFSDIYVRLSKSSHYIVKEGIPSRM